MDDSSLTKFLKQGIYGTYYLLNKKSRINQNELVNANPDLNLTLELWNMLENKFLIKAMVLTAPMLKVHERMCIPMVDTILTRENIGDLPVFMEAGVPNRVNKIKDLKDIEHNGWRK